MWHCTNSLIQSLSVGCNFHLKFQDRNHLDLLYDCSLELASSNKPHSCESAAYFLRILAQQQKQPLKMSATNQSECIMGIVEDLCGLLRSQISVAKESLLEASVQGPMYGILHCIREILNDVKYRYVSTSKCIFL